jgi:hypothetical protein
MWSSYKVAREHCSNNSDLTVFRVNSFYLNIGQILSGTSFWASIDEDYIHDIYSSKSNTLFFGRTLKPSFPFQPPPPRLSAKPIPASVACS